MCLKNYGQRGSIDYREVVVKQELEIQKPKWLPEEALQIAEERREVKAEEKKKEYPSESRLPKNSKERFFKKPFLSKQWKEIEENNRMGKIKISSRKLEMPRKHFMQRGAQ